MIIGFTWGGWVTGATATDRAQQAAQKAEAQLAANLCVSRFEKATDAASELAALKSTEFWQREDFIAKGPWLKLPGMDRPIQGAASLCVDRLMSAKLAPAAPVADNKG